MKTNDVKVVHDEKSLYDLVNKCADGCVVENDNHFDVGENVKSLSRPLRFENA